MNQKLQKVFGLVNEWCRNRNVLYDIVCDEDDLQGYLILKPNHKLVPYLLEFLLPTLQGDGLHVSQQRTRNGVVVAFSPQAIAETMLNDMLPLAERSTRLTRRLDLIFSGPVSEDLDGLAAKFQPGDVLQRLSKAATATAVETPLGNSNLLDALHAAGISNGLSDDKQVLHFYLQDADGRKREVASYQLVDVGDKNKFAEVIDDLRDLAMKHSPGTGRRTRQRAKDEESALRKIADRFAAQPEQPLE